MKYLREFETPSDVNGWRLSESHINPNVVLVASTNSILYDVSALDGVLIQHIDGSLYSTNEWTNGGYSNDEANGVALIADNCKFVIAKVSLGQLAWSPNNNVAVDGVMLTSDTVTAQTDYAGETNTALIAAGVTSGAAYSCANYAFPNGQKGYLPALGELKEALSYKSDIDSAMTIIGGTSIGDLVWSSTQNSNSYAWLVNWASGLASISLPKNYSREARPFSSLIF